ncbi:MAG: 3-dehydroquinate synthase [Gemmataceae bacterium]|nr:3-dehydroquinate synthase [Gemmataceae bacterium]
MRVELGPRGYDINLGAGFLDSLVSTAPSLAKASSAFILCDEKVERAGLVVKAGLEKAGLRAGIFLLPSGEGQKCLESASRLYDQLAQFHADRKTVVIPVGGGVTGDLGGFAAATFNRGIPLFMVPTTLLAMVDSSVGGKTGINHPMGKNLIGAFHQPAGVAIDMEVLSTLGEREYRSGLAEVVKYGMILDAPFFEFLETAAPALLQRKPLELARVIRRSCELKALVVSQDEREETGLRAILNLGHTFAHAFETVLGYGAWLHGEAVASGMVCATRLAFLRGLIEEKYLLRAVSLLKALQLPVDPPSASAEKLLAVMRSDKKSVQGRLRLILPVKPGEAALFDCVSEAEVRKVLAPDP